MTYSDRLTGMSLISEIEELRDKLAELERKATTSSLLETLRNLPNRTVIRFEKRFGVQMHSVVAIKRLNRWYGSDPVTAIRTDEDMEKFLNEALNIRKVSGWTAL